MLSGNTWPPTLNMAFIESLVKPMSELQEALCTHCIESDEVKLVVSFDTGLRMGILGPSELLVAGIRIFIKPFKEKKHERKPSEGAEVVLRIRGEQR